MFPMITAALEGGTNGSTNLWGGLVTIAVFVLLLAVFSIRSQRKKDRQTNEMISSLQVGDEITTIGGIIGKIVSITEETLVLETTRNCTKIRILKSAVRCVDVRAEDAE